MPAAKPPLDILLCSPRGFCAGVDRAIQIVELALERFGAPVYVRHEIVHNRYVVDGLRAKGAVFVEDLDEIPNTDQPVIFSAHGVAKAVPAAAAERHFFQLDATCPLVTKVHREAEIHFRKGREIVLIGHAGHPEVEGTMGQLPPGAITLIETEADARAFQPKSPDNLAFITQTTLSVDETAGIIAALREKFPNITSPKSDDICYATTNRQLAVKQLARECDLVLVIGSKNSSNSNRLVDVTRELGTASHLIDNAGQVREEWLDGVETVGITSGASAPEELVEALVEFFRERGADDVSELRTVEEDVRFMLPKEIRTALAERA
jgi:4-hydroxy-3-methylbut-2-enyl diphosphate reductase